MTQSEPIVSIVDDDQAVCRAIALLVESIGLETKTFGSAAEFLNSCQTDRPTCVVLDIRMPHTSGLALLEELDARGIKMPVIVVTAHGDMSTAVKAMKLGAIDCLAKPFNEQTLIDRIQEGIALDRNRKERRARYAAIDERLARLTQRERQVLEAMLEGGTSQRIAESLGLTKKTIDAHRAKVMKKMEVRSLVQLVRLVMDFKQAGKQREAVR